MTCVCGWGRYHPRWDWAFSISAAATVHREVHAEAFPDVDLSAFDTIVSVAANVTRQPREQAVLCWCLRSTWNLSGLCDLHEISDAATPTAASGAGPSNPAATTEGAPVAGAVVANFSQAPAGLGDDRDPAPGASDRHGSVAVPVTFPPAADAGAAEVPPVASAAVHDHARTRTAGPSTGTATRRGVDGTHSHCLIP